MMIFWSRLDSLQVSSATSSIDISSFGTPSASYPSSSCDIESFFGSQQLVLDISLCGEWAGAAAALEETCPALVDTQTCYTTYVLDATNYDEAYFEIKSINRVG